MLPYPSQPFHTLRPFRVSALVGVTNKGPHGKIRKIPLFSFNDIFFRRSADKPIILPGASKSLTSRKRHVTLPHVNAVRVDGQRNIQPVVDDQRDMIGF